MTVKELIDKLQQANPDAEVCLNITDEKQEIDDLFEVVDVDNSLIHPYDVYISNVVM